MDKLKITINATLLFFVMAALSMATTTVTDTYVETTGSMNASDWTNISITESQISDLGTYLTVAINDSYYLANNPYGFYNDTDFSITNYYNKSDSDNKFFSDITNFTGTLTDTKICVWDDGNNQINCNYDDQLGGGGSGDPHWIDGGDYLYPNTSYADNIRIPNGYIESGNWTNVSITESQISDLGVYYPYSNPHGYFNDSDFSITDYWPISTIEGFGYYNSSDFDIADYSTTADMNTAIGNANTSMKAYVDAQDVAYNTSAGEYCEAYVGDQGFLTSYTETDPYWTNNQSSYFTKSEIDNFEFWNSTLAYFNETYADTLYSPISEPFWTNNMSSYFTKSEIDSFGYYNSSDFDIADYSTTADMNTAIGNANTTMKDYVDAADSSQDACSEITDCVVGAITQATAIPDANVTDDLTITSTHMINTTSVSYSTKYCADGNCNVFMNDTGHYVNGGLHGLYWNGTNMILG